MTIKAPALIALAVLALGTSACMHDSAADLPPGKYQSSKSATDANGTTYDKDTTTNVWVDSNGDKHVSNTTKKSTDPKGLFNKNTSTSTTSTTY